MISCVCVWCGEIILSTINIENDHVACAYLVQKKLQFRHTFFGAFPPTGFLISLFAADSSDLDTVTEHWVQPHIRFTAKKLTAIVCFAALWKVVCICILPGSAGVILLFVPMECYSDEFKKKKPRHRSVHINKQITKERIYSNGISVVFRIIVNLFTDNLPT